MKRSLVSVGWVLAALSVQAATITVNNPDFANGPGNNTHDFNGWHCPTADNCDATQTATLDTDPYWMRVNNDYGSVYSGHFGAAIPNADWIWQTISGLSANSVYTVAFTYGEEYPYAAYGQPSEVAGEFDLYWVGDGSGWTSAGGPPTSASNGLGLVFQDPITDWGVTTPNAPAHSGTTINGSYNVAATGSSMVLGFGGYDFLQDVYVTSISVTECPGCTTGPTGPFTGQSFDPNGLIGDTFSFDPAAVPEPGTLGMMFVAGVVIAVAATRKLRPASQIRAL